MPSGMCSLKSQYSQSIQRWVKREKKKTQIKKNMGGETSTWLCSLKPPKAATWGGPGVQRERLWSGHLAGAPPAVFQICLLTHKANQAGSHRGPAWLRSRSLCSSVKAAQYSTAWALPRSHSHICCRRAAPWLHCRSSSDKEKKKKEGRGGVGVYALQIEPSRSDAHSVDGNKNFT